ncbi:MAG: NAD(P)/FAD-dependent oxidoreductase [Bacteroidia bacterium]|nr:NAD(P)/FAD-dependent oxidoreductase [Bacteroidia bacterium]
MIHADVIVVGGGAAGLMAAGKAAGNGARTILLEKMNRCGRKLLITGKGRCNITNSTSMADFISHIHNGKFLRPAFSAFFNKDLISLFESFEVKTVVERGNRVFPISEKSEDVVNALLHWCWKNKAEIITGLAVKEMLISDHQITGLVCEQHNGERLEFRTTRVILATGGKSYPATGSTGDGYKLATAAGHTIVPVRPALVPLVTKGDTAKKLQGLSLRNINASLWINEKKVRSEFGEMLFTHYGISGPVILTMSRLCTDALNAGSRVIISIDLKPALDEHKLDARLLRDLAGHSKMKTINFLGELLPSSLIPVCCELLSLDPDKPCHQVSAAERKKIRLWLKDFRLEVTGHRSFNEAIITAGGVDLGEINQATMESKLVKGLFFAGEILDLDADTGGYNLQIAFSTGWMAGGWKPT